MQIRSQLEVVEAREEPLEIGRLVRERRLGQLDIALLDRRAEDHLSPDPDGGRLRASDERRHLHSQVGRDLDAAGEPPAAAELVGREGARVERRDRRAAVEHLDLALAARTVAPARGVDGDAVPAGRVEEHHARRNPDLAAGRLEQQVESTPAVMGRIAAVDGHGASSAVRACRVATVTSRLGSPKARHEPPDACSDRCAAIQDAPHGSRSSRRSAALIGPHEIRRAGVHDGAREAGLHRHGEKRRADGRRGRASRTTRSRRRASCSPRARRG